VLERQGDLLKALEAYRNSLVIRERLVKADPSNPGWQGDLSRSYASMASLQQKLNNTREALIALHKGREIVATLVTLAPSNAQWKKDLAWFDGEIARLEERAKEAGKN
jgi:hypothetical protein